MGLHGEYRLGGGSARLMFQVCTTCTCVGHAWGGKVNAMLHFMYCVCQTCIQAWVRSMVACNGVGVAGVQDGWYNVWWGLHSIHGTMAAHCSHASWQEWQRQRAMNGSTGYMLAGTLQVVEGGR